MAISKEEVDTLIQRIRENLVTAVTPEVFNDGEAAIQVKITLGAFSVSDITLMSGNWQRILDGKDT